MRIVRIPLFKKRKKRRRSAKQGHFPDPDYAILKIQNREVIDAVNKLLVEMDNPPLLVLNNPSEIAKDPGLVEFFDSQKEALPTASRGTMVDPTVFIHFGAAIALPPARMVGRKSSSEVSSTESSDLSSSEDGEVKVFDQQENEVGAVEGIDDMNEEDEKGEEKEEEVEKKEEEEEETREVKEGQKKGDHYDISSMNFDNVDYEMFAQLVREDGFTYENGRVSFPEDMRDESIENENQEGEEDEEKEENCEMRGVKGEVQETKEDEKMREKVDGNENEVVVDQNGEEIEVKEDNSEPIGAKEGQKSEDGAKEEEEPIENEEGEENGCGEMEKMEVEKTGEDKNEETGQDYSIDDMEQNHNSASSVHASGHRQVQPYPPPPLQHRNTPTPPPDPVQQTPLLIRSNPALHPTPPMPPQQVQQPSSPMPPNLVQYPPPPPLLPQQVQQPTSPMPPNPVQYPPPPSMAPHPRQQASRFPNSYLPVAPPMNYLLPIMPNANMNMHAVQWVFNFPSPPIPQANNPMASPSDGLKNEDSSTSGADTDDDEERISSPGPRVGFPHSPSPTSSIDSSIESLPSGADDFIDASRNQLRDADNSGNEDQSASSKLIPDSDMPDASMDFDDDIMIIEDAPAPQAAAAAKSPMKRKLASPTNPVLPRANPPAGTFAKMQFHPHNTPLQNLEVLVNRRTSPPSSIPFPFAPISISTPQAQPTATTQTPHKGKDNTEIMPTKGNLNDDMKKKKKSNRDDKQDKSKPSSDNVEEAKSIQAVPPSTGSTRALPTTTTSNNTTLNPSVNLLPGASSHPLRSTTIPHPTPSTLKKNYESSSTKRKGDSPQLISKRQRGEEGADQSPKLREISVSPEKTEELTRMLKMKIDEHRGLEFAAMQPSEILVDAPASSPSTRKAEDGIPIPASTFATPSLPSFSKLTKSAVFGKSKAIPDHTSPETTPVPPTRVSPRLQSKSTPTSAESSSPFLAPAPPRSILRNRSEILHVDRNPPSQRVSATRIPSGPVEKPDTMVEELFAEMKKKDWDNEMIHTMLRESNRMMAESGGVSSAKRTKASSTTKPSTSLRTTPDRPVSTVPVNPASLLSAATTPPRRKMFSVAKSPSPEHEVDVTKSSSNAQLMGIMKMPGSKKPENGGTSMPDETPTHTRCNLCNKWFLKDHKQKVRYHALHHCPMKAYQCRYCEYNHHELGKIKRHQKNVHGRNEDVLQYDNVLISAAYDVYMKRCFPNYDTGKLSIGRVINYPSQVDDLQKCMLCKKKVYKSLAAYHIVDKHVATKIYNCTKCDFKCIFKRELVLHCQAVHLTDSSMDILSNKMDFTDNTLFVLKSFFPEQIEPSDPNCEYELRRMAQVLNETFDKNVEMRELMAKQDGLEHTLNQPTAEQAKCRLCDVTGSTPPFKTVYDMVLHTKSHVKKEDRQWKCPERHCFFTSNYKFDVDVHAMEKHEKNTCAPINRWHQLVPTFMAKFRSCFPSVAYLLPKSSLRYDDRAKPENILDDDGETSGDNDTHDISIKHE